jgi:hypothetical protein
MSVRSLSPGDPLVTRPRVMKFVPLSVLLLASAGIALAQEPPHSKAAIAGRSPTQLPPMEMYYPAEPSHGEYAKSALALWSGNAATLADSVLAQARRNVISVPNSTDALFHVQALIQFGRFDDARALLEGMRSRALKSVESGAAPPPDSVRAMVLDAVANRFPNPLVGAWVEAAEQLAAAIDNEDASLQQIERAEALLDSLRAACIPDLDDKMHVRSIPNTLGESLVLDPAAFGMSKSKMRHREPSSIAELLLPEVEWGLARCALARNDLQALWDHLERSRDPLAIPIPLREMQSVLYGSEAALLLYDGGSWNPPIALWVSANHAQATVLSERPAMIQAANAAGTRFAADPEFASRFIPDRPTDDSVRRLYVAPPLGLESFPFDSLQYPVSYTPTGSMLRDRSNPRLWSGNKLVIFTGAPIPSPFRLSELSGLVPPRAHESARTTVRDSSILHEPGTADELLRVHEDEPIVLHLDLVTMHHPGEPDYSAIVCGDLETVQAREIAELGITTDLVVIGAASDGDVPLALGRGNLVDAFMRAGARSVVIPRWKVDPEVAERFYAVFYDQLHQALPRDEAFRNAQLALLEEGIALRDVYAFAHWGAGNIPVYVMSRKDSVAPLLIGWIAFIPPVVIAIALLRRRYLRRLDSRGRQTYP